MKCNIKDTLLRFKIEDKTKTINLIGSYEDSVNIPGINKIAAVTSIERKGK